MRIKPTYRDLWSNEAPITLQCFGKEHDLFKKQLENYFIIDQDSLALADLKDLTLEDAVGSIMAALLSPQGRLKPPAALRKLEAQAARLREGTSENPALNLVAGILQLVTGPNESSGWQQLMWSATGEAGSHQFWFGAGRPVLEKLAETDQLVTEAMARFLVSRYERVIGEPILASETWLTGDMFEWIEMHDSDFFG